MQGLYLHRNQQKRIKRAAITHTPRGLRNRDPSVRAMDGTARPRPRGRSDTFAAQRLGTEQSEMVSQIRVACSSWRKHAKKKRQRNNTESPAIQNRLISLTSNLLNNTVGESDYTQCT